MPKIITQKFNVHNAKQFVESLTEPANTSYYVFAGNHVPYGLGDNESDDSSSARIPSQSPENVNFNVFQSMIFGKRVTTNDVYHMCKRTLWSHNTVYDMYNDTDSLLYQKDFFVSVAGNAGFDVFKCLFNNNDGPSTSIPSLNETSPGDEIYIKPSDGYQWKYMFSVPDSVDIRIGSSELLPVIPNADVVNSSVNGAIDVIRVVDTGSKYFAVANGIVTRAVVNGDTHVYELQSSIAANVSISNTTGGEFIEGKVRLYDYNFSVDVEYLTDLRFSVGDIIIDSSSFAIVGTALKTNNNILIIGNVPRILRGGFFGFTLIRQGDTEVSGPFADAISFTRIKNYISNGIVTQANTNWLKIIETDGELGSAIRVENSNLTIESDVDDVRYLTSALSANNNFFKDMALYVTHGKGAGQIATIGQYLVAGGSRSVILDTNLATPLDTTSRVEITPRVTITGDGENAIARAIVNSNSFSVDKIEIVSRGTGYTYADATVTGNTGIVGTEVNNATIRVIIGPKGGHGSNPIEELYASTIGIGATFDGTESGQIPASNDYRQIGLIRDPLFANTAIGFTGTSIYLDGETVTGETSGATGVVISSSSSMVNLTDVLGEFVSGENITGSTTVTEGVIDTVISNGERAGSGFSTFDQRSILGDVNDTSIFTVDNRLLQSESSAEGYIHEILSTSIALTRVRGDFLSDGISPISEEFAPGVSGTFTSYAEKDLKEGSGEVLYIENTTPISRFSDQSEQVKLFLKF